MAMAVRTEQLSKRYGPTMALDGLDLEIELGEVFLTCLKARPAIATPTLMSRPDSRRARRHSDLWPLLPALATAVALGVVAVVLAGRRDAGDGMLATRDVVRPRPFGLRSSVGLAARLELPVLAAYGAGAAAAGVVLGMIGKLTTAAVPSSLRDTLVQFGVQGSFAKQYFGVAFLLVGTVVALLPASQVGAACEEEMSGRLVHVLVNPTRRTTWLGGRIALTGGPVVAAGLLAGLGAWVGAATQGVDVSFATMVGAGLNVVPTALIALGVGAVVLAVAPRAAAASVYAVVGWSLLIDLVGSMVSSLAWLEHLSMFHYMALAPGQDLDATSIAIMSATGVTLCIVATVLFDRRDVRTV